MSTAFWSAWAAETRGRIAAQQATANLPWNGVDDPSEMQRLHAEHTAKMHRIHNFLLGGPQNLTGADDPRRTLQEHGGLADFWFVDDGDILCHPILVPSYIHVFDAANEKVGAERNPQKTEVIRKIDEVRLHASVSTVAAGSTTLRVAEGPRQFITDQLLAKADVIRAMHARVQLCQDSQTDFALLRQRR